MPNRHDASRPCSTSAPTSIARRAPAQFAVMGSALVAAVWGKEEPTVGLLNIGE
jgi:glycerol-3-phosphate acyltransferase PlsX